MRRITYWFLSTLTTLVLLFGYHTSTSGADAQAGASSAYVSGSSTGTSTTQTTQTKSSSTNSSGSSSTPSASAAHRAASRSRSSNTKRTTHTVTGSVAQTQWGPVQVQLSMSGATITKVTVLQYPSGNPRDEQINAYALPILIEETTTAQSAQVDMVSGATVTSTGYLQSLQSALDQAGA